MHQVVRALEKEITSDKIMQILRRVKNTTQWRSVQQKGCGRVCIGCLLDFRNQMESDRMDRKLGYQILSYQVVILKQLILG